MNKIHNQPLSTRAIIIGGSIAGLLTARVLSEHFGEVLVIEKDKLVDKPVPRRGVPQSGQTHSIHQKGAEIIQDLFPDLTWDFENSGVIPCDLGSEMRWFFYGEWMERNRSDVFVHWCDRPQLEWQIRKRVLALPNVQLLDDCKVVKLMTDFAGDRVTGVTVRLPDGVGGKRPFTADLIVDACGRGSRVSQWLNHLEYPQVPVSEVKIDLGYASGIFQLPENSKPSWKALLISAKPGLSQKLGLIYRMPNNQIKVLLAGWFGDHPPTELDEFLAFAKSLPQPDIYEQLRAAQPLAPVKAYKLPSNKWNHFEKASRWPKGLCVLGDAVCSFNPSFGQGMTVAALHAIALGEQVQKSINQGKSLANSGLSRRFQKEAARIVGNPWMITTGEDLRFPEAEGPRPFSLPIAQTYLAQVFDVAHHNPAVAKQFFEVMTFMKEPPALFHPKVLFSVMNYSAGKMIKSIGRKQHVNEKETFRGDPIPMK